MPRKLVCSAPHQLEWIEYAEAPLAMGQVRIKSQVVSAKHGTEIALYKGYYDRGGYNRELGMFDKSLPSEWPYPLAMGNMVVGVITEVSPDVTTRAVGDRVLSFGGFRPTQVCDVRHCWRLPAAVAWQDAVCTDPAVFALAALRDGHVRMGDSVAIVGLGAIGLMLVQLARAAGASSVFAVDPVPARRQLAQQMGAAGAFAPHDGEPAVAIRRATAGAGVDAAIDFSGAAAGLQSCLRAVAYGGTVVAGAYPPPYGAGLDFGAEPHRHRVNLVFSRGCSEPDRDHPRWTEKRLYDTCFEMICRGVIGDRGICSAVPETQLADEYQRVAAGTSSCIKMAVVYE